MKRNAYLIFASALALTACGTAGGGNETVEARGDQVGIVAASMDRSVKPGDDWFAFTNGGWVKNTPIPEDRSSIGAFYMADQQREKQVRELVDGLLKSNPDAGSNEARIVNYYNAFLNTDGIDRAGLAPIKGDLDAIAGISDKKALSAAIGNTLRADTDPLNSTNYQTENLFGIFVTQGLNSPGEQMPYVMQGGLGLPEREYYLSDDGEMTSLRAKYQAHVQRMFQAAGYPDAAGAAKRIMDLETKIAGAHATRQESEDFAKGATVWTRAELERNAPGIDWGALLGAAQLGQAPRFQAYHAGAIPKIAALVASEPLQSWKEWLAFHQLNQHADVLPKPFRNAHFAFYATALSGTPQQRSRDRLALDAVGNDLQDAVGKAYVDKYFPASAKAQIQTMVEEIKSAFARRVESLDWMAPSTREEALKKVRSIVVGVGYPETWRDYSNLVISPDNAYANRKNAQLAEYRHQIAKIGKPMDRREWWMPPQLVNAVNLPVQNALNFPAAILQRPFFDPNADAAFNYGAIGSVIGHEISHSFDNNGALFDSTGRLRNWWTPADLQRFEQSGKALADQYSAYEALPGLRVNGTLTLGENIADVAGLNAAYDAYRHSLGGKEAPVIDGLTGDQRFFIAFGQAWASKFRDENLRQRIATGVHAPGQFRALTVRNLDGWYPAFKVQPGEKLYLPPEKRVKVW